MARLPDGSYNGLFIHGLAKVASLKLIRPQELADWFDSGKSHTEIAEICLERAKVALASRKKH